MGIRAAQPGSRAVSAGAPPRGRLHRLRGGAVLLGILGALGSGAPAASAAAPAIGDVWVSHVQTTAAQVNAEVDPNGKASSYHVEYIRRSTYDSNVAAAKDGFSGSSKLPPSGDSSIFGLGPSTLGPQLFGLSSATAYRYRFQVKNADGTTTGPTRELVTHSTAPFALPDGRGWEMVSPVEKNGGQVAPPGALAGGGVLQAAGNGQSVTYGSAASFAQGAGGAPPASQYVSARTAGGWSTQNISLPLLSGSYADDEGSPYRLFSADLARAVHLNAHRCEPGDPCPRDYFLRDNHSGSLLASPQQPDLSFAGASPDLKHVVLSTCAALTPNATEVPLGEGCDPSEPNLYKWSAGGLSLLNVLPTQSQGTPGAALAAPSGAVSANGDRVYWNDLASGNLYQRQGSGTKQVDTAAGGGATLETATADGAIALYSKAGHLWRYDALAGSSADLTPAGDVLGVLGTSANASSIYYLTASGLFLRAGTTTAKVAEAADAANHPPATGTARVSADGSKLLFISTTPLTTSDGATYDNVNTSTKAPESQIYLYDHGGAGTLTCVSCNPTRARPLGPSRIPGAIANGEADTTHSYKPRVLSDDGRRVFFESRDALVRTDVNLAPDVYQWEAQGKGSCTRAGGCVALISAGLAGSSSFADASGDGANAFFLTDRSLVGADPGSTDLYDARIGGGFPEPAPQPPCVGDACQGIPPTPEDPVLTTVLAGPGNPGERYRQVGSATSRRCPKGKRPKTVRTKRGKKVQKCVKRRKRCRGSKKLRTVRAKNGKRVQRCVRTKGKRKGNRRGGRR